MANTIVSVWALVLLMRTRVAQLAGKSPLFTWVPELPSLLLLQDVMALAKMATKIVPEIIVAMAAGKGFRKERHFFISVFSFEFHWNTWSGTPVTAYSP